MKKLICSLALLAACALSAAPAAALEALYGLTGLYLNKEDAFQGYTLVTPQGGKEAHLIDMQGRKVHSWKLPGTAFYGELLPSGNLLVSIDVDNAVISFGGAHGQLMEFDWDGNVVWKVTRNSKQGILHHGFDRMPNGHTLALAWEEKSWDEAKAKGRKDIPSAPIKTFNGTMAEGIWPDMICEFDQNGDVVWEWHVWDHVGTGKDQFDINHFLPDTVEGNLYKYPDWTHFNSVRYNEKTDQIAFSSRQFGELYIIDKKTGKLVWRWGNPGAYGGGKLPSGYALDGDQELFGPHDVNWLANGNLSVFDNGTFRPSGAYSRVVEVNPKTGKIAWQFSLDREFPNGFYAAYQSSAQKLPNNNYLVATTPHGHIFEVTPTKEIVWEYVNPVGGKTGPLCVNGFDGRTNRLHRAFRYGPDFPGLKGKPLTPGDTLNPGCPQMEPLLAPYLK